MLSCLITTRGKEAPPSCASTASPCGSPCHHRDVWPRQPPLQQMPAVAMAFLLVGRLGGRATTGRGQNHNLNEKRNRAARRRVSCNLPDCRLRASASRTTASRTTASQTIASGTTGRLEAGWRQPGGRLEAGWKLAIASHACSARSCKDAKCAEPTLWPTPTPVNLAPTRKGARKRYGVPKSSKGFWGTEALWGGGGAGLLFTGRG